MLAVDSNVHTHAAACDCADAVAAAHRNTQPELTRHLPYTLVQTHMHECLKHTRLMHWHLSRQLRAASHLKHVPDVADKRAWQGCRINPLASSILHLA